MFSLTQYLRTLAHPEGLCRRLGGLTLLHDAAGRPCCRVGNSAVVFRVCVGGRIRRLRCYLRPPAFDLETRYGGAVLRRELYLHTGPDSGVWVDVVLDDWVEGTPLDETVDAALRSGDTPTLRRLSHTFDHLAAELLADDWAHGDLKPENLIVTPDRTLRLIDFDGCYRPGFPERQAPELGTPAYRHPSRTAGDYNAFLDHYPATLLAVQLRALALDPSLPERHPAGEGWLFEPAAILSDRSAAYREVLTLFARAGDGAHYRLARALRQHHYALGGVAELFAHMVRLPDSLGGSARELPRTEEALFLYAESGRYGYRTEREVVIPPLYDEATPFDARGEAEVRIGCFLHRIDRRGRLLRGR